MGRIERARRGLLHSFEDDESGIRMRQPSGCRVAPATGARRSAGVVARDPRTCSSACVNCAGTHGLREFEAYDKRDTDLSERIAAVPV